MTAKRKTMRVVRSNVVVAVAVAIAVAVGIGVGAFGGIAAAQPAPGDADAALRDQCTGVIKRSADHTDNAEVLADEARRTHQPVPEADATVKWTQQVIGDLWPLTKRYKADDLNAAAQASHDQAAAEVATNKRHVILAYAALWVLAAVFLVVLWRRQQGLKAQIAELKRDLDAAVKEAS